MNAQSRQAGFCEAGGRAVVPRGSWEPPASPTRAAGGLLGVVAGEAEGWAGEPPPGVDRPPGPGRVVALAPRSDGSRSTIARALVDLAESYVGGRGQLPLHVARRHQGVSTPAWLLAVAVVRIDQDRLVGDTLELAVAAGVPRSSLPACVTYVELAAGLFAGRSVAEAVEAATGAPPPDGLVARPRPHLSGETAVDGVQAGIWALLRPGGVAEVMPTVQRLSTPGVGAAVAGLLGLRDGCGALPPVWHRRPAAARDCFELAPGLVRARCLGVGRPAGGRGRAGAGRAGTAGEVEPVGSGRSVEAVDPTGTTGSVAGLGDGAGVGAESKEVTAANAVTEELEAIEERVPVPVLEEADGPGASRQRDGRRSRRQNHRRLEGAGTR